MIPTREVDGFVPLQQSQVMTPAGAFQRDGRTCNQSEEDILGMGNARAARFGTAMTGVAAGRAQLTIPVAHSHQYGLRMPAHLR